ncbi:hypothetical protein X759_35760 [Mesorhizobium sp. LSHC420B00]|nr:hypothetical protein X759_35760 [Mesorhizobium sp. LSHC420B00]
MQVPAGRAGQGTGSDGTWPVGFVVGLTPPAKSAATLRKKASVNAVAMLSRGRAWLSQTYRNAPSGVRRTLH